MKTTPSRGRTVVSVLLYSSSDPSGSPGAIGRSGFAGPTEPACVAELVGLAHRTAAALEPFSPHHEVIVLRDGGAPASPMLSELVESDRRFVVRQRARRAGPQALLQEGLAIARGTVIAALDVAGRFAPEQIPCLLQGLKLGFDVVAARPVRGRLDLTPAWRAGRGFALLASAGTRLGHRRFESGLKVLRRHASRALLAPEAGALRRLKAWLLPPLRTLAVELPVAR